LAYVAATTVSLVLGIVGKHEVLAMAISGIVVAAVGFWDDHANLSRKLRLLVQVGASAWALYWLGGLPVIVFGPVEVEGGLFGAVISVVAVTWLINLFNFMDGIDAIASLEAITVSLGAGLILWWNGSPTEAYWVVLLAAATLGFLFWNWPPAKIFMGDAGSGFLGFTLGVLAIATSQSELINLWAWLILLGVFFVDATVTLVTRMLRRDRWYEAHRSHAYQHAARALGSHLPVSMGVAIVNIMWLLPLAWAAADYPNWAWLLMTIAYLPLVVGTIRLRAGYPESATQSG
jgi:Fuc2NAc and GlcNAc transferase